VNEARERGARTRAEEHTIVGHAGRSLLELLRVLEVWIKSLELGWKTHRGVILFVFSCVWVGVAWVRAIGLKSGWRRLRQGVSSLVVFWECWLTSRVHLHTHTYAHTHTSRRRTTTLQS
jgi:hypothetical protein